MDSKIRRRNRILLLLFIIGFLSVTMGAIFKISHMDQATTFLAAGILINTISVIGILVNNLKVIKKAF